MVVRTGIQCTAGIVTFELCTDFGFSSLISSSLEEAPKPWGWKRWTDFTGKLFCKKASVEEGISSVLHCKLLRVSLHRRSNLSHWTVQLRASHALYLRTSMELKSCHGLQVNPLQQGKIHLWEKNLVHTLFPLYFLAYNVKCWSWCHCSWLFWFHFRVCLVWGFFVVVILWKTLCYSAVEMCLSGTYRSTDIW